MRTTSYLGQYCERTTYLKLFIPIFAIWFLGFVIAYFAPDTVLTDYPLLSIYASAMSFISNPQGLVSTQSSFPEITVLYYSVIWWSFPFLFLVWWKWLNSQIGVSKTGIFFKTRLSFIDRFVIIAAIPVWIFLAYVGFTLNHGGDTRLVALGSSRLQFAILGIGIPSGSAAVLAFLLFSIKRIFTSEGFGEKL